MAVVIVLLAAAAGFFSYRSAYHPLVTGSGGKTQQEFVPIRLPLVVTNRPTPACGGCQSSGYPPVRPPGRTSDV